MYCWECIVKKSQVFMHERETSKDTEMSFLLSVKKIYMYVFRKEWHLRRLWLQSVSVPYFLERCMYFVLNSLSVFWRKKKSPFPFRLFKGDDKFLSPFWMPCSPSQTVCSSFVITWSGCMHFFFFERWNMNTKKYYTINRALNMKS